MINPINAMKVSIPALLFAGTVMASAATKSNNNYIKKDTISIETKIAKIKSLNKHGDNTKIDSKKEAKTVLKLADTADMNIFDDGGDKLFEAVMEAIEFLSGKNFKQVAPKERYDHIF